MSTSDTKKKDLLETPRRETCPLEPGKPNPNQIGPDQCALLHWRNRNYFEDLYGEEIDKTVEAIRETKKLLRKMGPKIDSNQTLRPDATTVGRTIQKTHPETEKLKNRYDNVFEKQEEELDARLDALEEEKEAKKLEEKLAYEDHCPDEPRGSYKRWTGNDFSEDEASEGIFTTDADAEADSD
ncbi:uncharacterized protein KY384_005648 [Bacidia gigantensis]|uniref:uncharacterized protein n=1 Tax=Bacidia gigantensis TaxID=2732470 RepID=UPI001D03B0EB|nr:uncharacterized protein KY384_005648 [Bacidia gigantensis]KAG8530165.1 hypothetical protein KY384_005648 [Bacidia gigantensis]